MLRRHNPTAVGWAASSWSRCSTPVRRCPGHQVGRSASPSSRSRAQAARLLPLAGGGAGRDEPHGAVRRAEPAAQQHARLALLRRRSRRRQDRADRVDAREGLARERRTARRQPRRLRNCDIERSQAFYERIGFSGLLFDSNGFFEPMDPWYATRTPPVQHMMLLTNPYGAGLEPVQHDPPSPDMRGEWGHLGPMDFGIGVTNLDRALGSCRRGHRDPLGAQTIEVDAGRGATPTSSIRTGSTSVSRKPGTEQAILSPSSAEEASAWPGRSCSPGPATASRSTTRRRAPARDPRRGC